MSPTNATAPRRIPSESGKLGVSLSDVDSALHEFPGNGAPVWLLIHAIVPL